MGFNLTATNWPTPQRLMQFNRVSLVPGVVLKGPIQYIFRLNPMKLHKTRQKLEHWSFTTAGFERMDWGQGMLVYSYSGSSGVFRLDEPASATVPPDDIRDLDIRNTYAWSKFVEFEKYFILIKEESIRMTWWGDPYDQFGSIGEFSFDVDADHPWMIAYSFKFSAIPDGGRPDLVINNLAAGL